MHSVQQEQLQTADHHAQVGGANTPDGEKNGLQQTTLGGDSSDPDSEAEDKKFQQGVRRVRAITSVWSKKTLVSMFIMYVSPSQTNRIYFEPFLTEHSLTGSI